MEGKRVKARVTKGSGRGGKIGVPTLNFTIPKDQALKHGVYAGWLYVKGKKFPIAIHFGPRPTFAEKKIALEAHIIGGSIPALPVDRVEIEFVSFCRPVKNFPSVQAMLEQIKKDVKSIETILSGR